MSDHQTACSLASGHQEQKEKAWRHLLVLSAIEGVGDVLCLDVL